MVHSILGINVGFWALQLLFLQNSCYVVFKKTNLIIYIERFKGIFMVYIDIIKPLFHLHCTNFKASLVIKIINFN
jgi:hypothetical protein